MKSAVAASLASASLTASQENLRAENSATLHADATHSAAAKIEFPRKFSGRNLARISCPLGGIGTGGIGLGGRGNLQDWQIFNRPDIGNSPQYAFPSLWVRHGDAKPFSAVLERRILPPYDTQSEGLGFANAPGLPRLAEATFHASYPISRIAFNDADCPVQVSLEAFSPFIPLDADASGLPCAILSYEIKNTSTTAAEAVIAWSIMNPAGNSDKRSNVSVEATGLHGILMSDPSLSADHALRGSFVLAAMPDINAASEVLPTWPSHSGWRVGPQHFWFDYFSRNGTLGVTGTPSIPVGSVAIRQKIPAGETRRFRYLLSWHFPNRTPERCGWAAPAGQDKAFLGNYYCTRFADAWEVAQHVQKSLPELEQGTRDFVQAITQTTLPDAVKDAATANLTTLVSNTSFRIADGSFHGFEGCGDHGGMGFGSCTHVWNYEVATQFLFPALARSMRETSFTYALDVDGHMDFRHKLPPSGEHWGAAAADGQMGQIVKLYMDWLNCGDNEWLKKLWPAVKRAMQYAWRPGGWDESKSGVMDGVQHNTYDIEYYGPNPMCTSWYLAALRASLMLAVEMQDAEFAEQCQQMMKQGSQWVDANLFNGEYYIQKVRGIPANKIASGLRNGAGAADTMHPEFQVGDGCQVDQLVGQYMANVAGLSDLLDPSHIRKTLASILRYNYKASLAHHASVQRTYALNDESALVICDFTRGTLPEVPMPYYAEVMTGFEYSAAILMLAYDMQAQGVECIANIRRRYDGERRNPLDESEYGRHYARAMASWAAIPVLSGFRHDPTINAIEFHTNATASTQQGFWSTNTAWGTFKRSQSNIQFKVVYGSQKVKHVLLPPNTGHWSASQSNRSLASDTDTNPSNQKTRINLAEILEIKKGNSLLLIRS